MYQYDDPTVSATLPTPAAAGTPGYFTDGSPTAGVAATELRSDFMNMIMMELLNVVEAAGETPSKTTYNQVLTAIETLIQQRTGHGQCRLSVASATSLVLKPYNGNSVIVNGVPLQLPSAGVSIANTGLAASTVYYVYLAGTTTSPSLVLSTTGHVTASNGVEVMNTDATKTLVGMVWANASGQFSPSAAGNRLLCRSWFNRSGTFDNITTASFNITNTSIAEISSTMRINFLCWADEATQVFTDGLIQNNTAGSNITVAGYIDGSSVTPTQAFTSPAANQGSPYNVGSVQQYSEAALHYYTLYGQVNGNTGTLTQNVNLLLR